MRAFVAYLLALGLVVMAAMAATAGPFKEFNDAPVAKGIEPRFVYSEVSDYPGIRHLKSLPALNTLSPVRNAGIR